MSLQSLISGSECALPNNPLAQVLKHTDADHSIQRDHTAGPSTSRVSCDSCSHKFSSSTQVQLQHLPVSSANRASEQDLQLARRFFEANRVEHQPHSRLGPSQQHVDLFRHSTAAYRSSTQPFQKPTSDVDLQRAWVQREGRLNGDFSLSSAWTNEFGSTCATQHSLDQEQRPLQSTHTQCSM